MVRRYIRFTTQNFYIWRDCTGGFCGTSGWGQKDKFRRPPKSWWHFQTLAALFLPKSLESSGMQRVLSGANNLLEASVVFVSKFEFYLGLKFPLVLHFILWFHIQLRDTLSLCSEIWLLFWCFWLEANPNPIPNPDTLTLTTRIYSLSLGAAIWISLPGQTKRLICRQNWMMTLCPAEYLLGR